MTSANRLKWVTEAVTVWVARSTVVGTPTHDWVPLSKYWTSMSDGLPFACASARSHWAWVREKVREAGVEKVTPSGPHSIAAPAKENPAPSIEGTSCTLTCSIETVFTKLPAGPVIVVPCSTVTVASTVASVGVLTE